MFIALALLALLAVFPAGCDLQLREMTNLPDPDAETTAEKAEVTEIADDASPDISSLSEDDWFSALDGFWLADDGWSASLRFAAEGFIEWKIQRETDSYAYAGYGEFRKNNDGSWAVDLFDFLRRADDDGNVPPSASILPGEGGGLILSATVYEENEAGEKEEATCDFPLKRIETSKLLTLRFVSEEEATEEEKALCRYDITDAGASGDQSVEPEYMIVTVEEDNTYIELQRQRNITEITSDGLLNPVRNDQETLNKGDSFAVLVRRAWHPELRVSAVCGSYSGTYDVGSDNWMGLETKTRFLIGYDPAKMKRGLPAEDMDNLNNVLCGDWVFYNEEEPTASLSLRRDGKAQIFPVDGGEAFLLSYELFTFDEEAQLPNMISFTADEGDTLPEGALEYGAKISDFTVYLTRFNGETLMYLKQSGNGDTVFGKFFGLDKTYDISLTFHRRDFYIPAKEAGAEEADTKKSMFIWRYDEDKYAIYASPAHVETDEYGYETLYIEDEITEYMIGVGESVFILADCYNYFYPGDIYDVELTMDSMVYSILELGFEF
jgi:hypothetical protein